MNNMLDKLREANLSRQDKWENAGDKLDLSYLGNALAGECGEACNIIKKLERERLGLRGSRAYVQDLAEELADIIIYLDLIAAKININLSEAVVQKFNKTSDKYSLGVYIDPRVVK